MAEKISGLTEATSLASDDLLVCVDISDTTMAATGTNKKIQASNLGLPGTGTVVREELARQTLTAQNVDVSFDPTGYDRLIIKGYIRSNNPSVSDVIAVQVNNSAAGSYQRQDHYASNGAVGSSTANDGRLLIINGASAPANAFSKISAEIEDPTNASRTFLIEAWGGNARTNSDLMNGRGVVHNASIVGPFTSLQLTSVNASNLDGYVIVYGERTL